MYQANPKRMMMLPDEFMDAVISLRCLGLWSGISAALEHLGKQGPALDDGTVTARLQLSFCPTACNIYRATLCQIPRSDNI